MKVKHRMKENINRFKNRFKRKTRKRKIESKIKFDKLKEFSKNLKPNKLLYESFSKTIDILASLINKPINKPPNNNISSSSVSDLNKKNKREDYDLLSYLKKDIIGNSSIIFSTILGIIGKTIGWRRLFLIPLEILTTFLVATYICVKVSYEFGFDPKEKKEKKFILDLVLRILTSKEIIKEKSKIYLNLNPKPIFILDNLKTNQKIISSIYEEIEKTYRERLEKNMNEGGKTNEKTSKNKTI
jgi:hypothetical protein